MSLPEGTRLGPYEIRDAIGAGGMGQVYRATDPRLHRDVAIKIPAVQFNDRSAREARLAASLNHPNICHIYDVGPDYLVMELVEGPTLAERLKEGPLPVDEALAIADQIAAALAAAHERGIVHRDLKPGNIKIGPQGTVKVLDFGLAKAAEEAPPGGDPTHSPTVTLEQATRTGVIVGTAGYMAPEQARGKAVDKRADIWAFGVVLYEMLTGRRLFQGETVSDTLAAVLIQQPEWDRVPARAQRLLRRCLEKDPQDRLRDIADARFLLEDAPQTAPAPRRNRAWKVAALVSALAALIALALLWTLKRPPASAPVMRLSVDLGDDAALSPIRSGTMALSPDGSRIVFITGQQIVNSKLAVRRLDQSKSTPLAGTEGAESPFFSPDGKFIGFFADGKLKKIDVAGGTPATLCDAASPREGSWGDADNIDFAPNNNGALWRVSSAGGTPQSITTLNKQQREYTHRFPQVLPGSRAVLFTDLVNGGEEGPIEALSLETGKRHVLSQPGTYGRYLPGGRLVYIHLGTLYAAPMDLASLQLTGSPVPLLEDVSYTPSSGAAAFTFSQTGILAYVAANPGDQKRPIGIVDEKGNLELLPVARARYSHPRVSPDHTRLAINLRSGPAPEVWLYEFATRRFVRFPFPDGDSINAIWTPDSKRLAFYSNAQTPGIYCMRADGAGSPVRLVEGTGLVPNSFSAGAARLLYEAQGGPNAGLWILPLDWSDPDTPKPGVPQRLEPGMEGPTEFSPDGRWLAYVNSRSGGPEVYVRPLSGSGGPWQISNGGNNPFWSHTSPELFYRGAPDSRIMVVSYSTVGDSISFAPPRQWNDTRIETFDPMPDGKHVVLIPAAEQKQATHATFLLNFMDDLRRRVPGK